MDTVALYFAKTKGKATIPCKRSEDAGYDIYACFDEDYIKLKPHETEPISTGIASACPADYYFQLQERGSTGMKGIGQRCGVIDSGYRGEWFIPLTNHNTVPIYFIQPDKVDGILEQTQAEKALVYPINKAICQAVLLPVPNTEIRVLSYDELCAVPSTRRTGNLGSSQK